MTTVPLLCETNNDEVLNDRTQMTTAEIEQQLKENKFLDGSGGIKEALYARDPMKIILFDAEKVVTMTDGEGDDESEPYEISIVDHLLQSAHEEMCRTCGPIYTDFKMCQETMQTLLRSKDTQAKQFILLCFIAVDEGLQNQLRVMYPTDGKEYLWLPEYIEIIKENMKKMLNTSWVNVPRPSKYNISHLLRVFLETIARDSPG